VSSFAIFVEEADQPYFDSIATIKSINLPAEETDPGAAHSHRYSVGRYAACCICARIASRWRTRVDVVEHAAREMAGMVGH
jgi:hypothetical protein